VKAVGVPAIDRQDRPATPLRVGQSTRAMVPDSVTEQGFEF
jgi:hypothetical protein